MTRVRCHDLTYTAGNPSYQCCYVFIRITKKEFVFCPSMPCNLNCAWETNLGIQAQTRLDSLALFRVPLSLGTPTVG